MKSFMLATALAVTGALGWADQASAQVAVTVGGQPVYTTGGTVVTSGYTPAYTYPSYYGTTVMPATGYTYTYPSTYVYPSTYTYPSTYVYPSYYGGGYGGYRGVRGWRRW